MSILAENVKRLREINHLSLDDIAKKAGINRCTVINVMQDKHEPRKETVRRLANVFKVSESQLMNEKIMGEVINVGEKVKALCQKQNMTQTKLAEKTGLEQHTISNIVRGKYNPQNLTLKRVARAFGVTVEELLSYKEET